MTNSPSSDSMIRRWPAAINASNAADAVAAGADVLVAGTATFIGGVDCYAANIETLRAMPA